MVEMQPQMEQLLRKGFFKKSIPDTNQRAEVGSPLPLTHGFTPPSNQRRKEAQRVHEMLQKAVGLIL